MTTREFLREFMQTHNRAQLGVIAAVAALIVCAGIAVGLGVGSGWLGVTAAAGTVALLLGVWWLLLGVERVQRWINDGRL